MRTLAAIILGAGVLGTGCIDKIIDEDVAGKAMAVAEREMIYVHDAVPTSDKNVQNACSEMYKGFETRAMTVRGLDSRWEEDGKGIEEPATMNVCCILKREVYDISGPFKGDAIYIKAGRCRKMQQLPEAEQ